MTLKPWPIQMSKKEIVVSQFCQQGSLFKEFNAKNADNFVEAISPYA